MACRPASPPGIRAAFLPLVIASLALWVSGCDQNGGGAPTDPLDPGGSQAPATGHLQVEVTTVGGPLPESFTLRVGTARGPVPVRGKSDLSDLPVGALEVGLEGVPGWCTVAGDNPRTVQVAARALTATPFFVACDPDRGILPRASGAPGTATVGPQGGVVQAVAPDGSRMRLTVPPGALSSPTEIRITPAAFQGLSGLVASFTGGAILEPAGLRFQVPATFALTPAGGTASLRFVAGAVFDEGGAPEWQLPRMDEAEESLLLDIRHFSGGVLGELFPGAWADVVEGLGLVPEVHPFGPTLQPISGAPGVVRQAPICVQVTSPQAGAPEPVPFLRAPVTFLRVEGPVRQFSPVEVFTDAGGVACAHPRIFDVDVHPSGSWVLAVAVAFPNTTFESGTRTSLFVFHENFPMSVRLEAPQAAVSDEPFRLCALVANREDPTRAIPGVRVVFASFPYAPTGIIPSAVSGADGQACTSVLLQLPDDQGGEEDVTIRATAPALDPLVDPSRPGVSEQAFVFHDDEITFPVARAPLILELEAPVTVALDESATICAVLHRGVNPQAGRDVFFSIASGGGRFPGVGGAERVAGVITGTAGPGRGCLEYRAPDSDREETVTLEARTRLRGDGSLVERITLQVVNPRPVLDLTPVPAFLTEDGAVGRICASLRDVGRFEPVVGATVVFAVEGPGALNPPEGDPLTTDAEGLVCVDYTAPDPLPDGTTPVTIRGEATSDDFEGTVTGSVVLELRRSPVLVSLSANPTLLETDGGTSRICAFVRLAEGGTPEVGTPVRFFTQGPGSVAGAGQSIPTNGEGLSCTDYNAPDPLPQGTTDVVIRAEVGPPASLQEASVTVRLQTEEEEEEEEVGPQPPCAEGVVTGNLSVSGAGQLGSLDGIGTVTQRLSLSGSFPERVDLRALCEVGDQLLIRGGFGGAVTEFPGGLLLSGLQFVGRTPNTNNPQTGTLRVERVQALTELLLPNLERAVARIQNLITLGGGVVVDDNPDLRRVVLGRDGGELTMEGILVTSNPLLEELAVRSGIRGTGFIAGASVPQIREVRISGNTSLRSIRTGRFWVQRLAVQNNAALTEVVLGGDSEIDALTVTGNLSLQSLDGIPCGTRILGGIFIEGNPQLDVGAVQALAAGCWIVHPDADVEIR